MTVKTERERERDLERKRHPDMKLDVIRLSASLLKPNGSKVQNADLKSITSYRTHRRQDTPERERERDSYMAGLSH